jgi:hypothetical protein
MSINIPINKFKKKLIYVTKYDSLFLENRVVYSYYKCIFFTHIKLFLAYTLTINNTYSNSRSYHYEKTTQLYNQ